MDELYRQPIGEIAAFQDRAGRLFLGDFSVTEEIENGWTRIGSIGPLVLHLASKIGRGQDTDDLIQTGLEAVITRISRTDLPRWNPERGSIGTWLYRHIRGAMLRTIDKHSPLPLNEEAVADNFEQSMAELEWIDVINTSFPEPQASVLVWNLLYELAPKDIAEVTGIPAGTVRSHLSRGRAALKADFLGVENDTV